MFEITGFFFNHPLDGQDGDAVEDGLKYIVPIAVLAPILLIVIAVIVIYCLCRKRTTQTQSPGIALLI